MNTKKWTKRVIAGSLFGIITVLVFNYIVNPYHIFSHNYVLSFFKVKDNLVDDEMSKFYAAKKVNPEVILVGSSRVEHLNPKDLKIYENGTIYNIAVKGSGLSSQYKLIHYFIKEKKVKTVILGLDFYAFSPANVFNHSDIIGTRYDNNFYHDYKTGLLSFRTFRKSISTIKDNLKHKPIRIDWETGWDSYTKDYIHMSKISDEENKQRINSAFPNFGNNSKFFGNEFFKNPKSIDKGLKIFQDIVLLCKENNVQLKVFTTPVYYRVYDVIRDKGYLKTYQYWKNELSQYKFIYDFNYKNSITQDYNNYVDASHYKSSVGPMIFKALYTGHIEKDFGRLLE